MTAVFKTLVLNRHHALCPGPTGTGKTVNISQYLGREAPEYLQSVFITFSAQTHVNQLQDLLDGKFEKRRRGVFGPPARKVFAIFVDDFNMPKKEEYGAQPPLELLRQWFDHKGWYDRKELTFREIVDVCMVAAMGPPGGGRTFISNRVIRHYNVLTYPDLGKTSIATIFNTILKYLFAPFDESIQKITETLVESQITVFEKALKELLPTPSKSHYTFNLRDIWKVFQGVCSLSPKIINNKLQVLRCWVHENCRVFGDRLIDDPDRQWLRKTLLHQCDINFDTEEQDIFVRERLIFGDFMVPGADIRHYQEIEDLDKMKSVIEEYLEDYNNVHTHGMPLVMFLDACEHITRICRVLRQPSGNCLLLGVGGSGRQSLSRMASFMMECACFQIEVGKGYGMNEWRDDLKRCLMKSGVEGKNQSFLFTDTQIIREAMLEDVNNVLNSGDVPNLYRLEDMDAIMTACRGMCQQLGLQPNKTNIFNCYLTRVKKNIHVILAMSPVGAQFRTRLRMFPSLVNCCTIDWFSEWPAEALYSVAKQQMMQSDLRLSNLEGVLNIFRTIHQSVEQMSTRFLNELRRYNYVTPTSYLELLSTFKTIMELKRDEIGTFRKRFQTGLDKLGDAADQVAQMQAQLTEMQPQLAQTQKEVGEKMVVIEGDKAKADETKKIVAKEEAEATAKAAETQAIKDDAQRDLDEALPALEQAVECLKRLKADHIREVKSLGKPPQGVILSMEAVCIMFQIPPVKKADPNNPAGKKIDDYWEASQAKLLKDPKKLLDDLMNFDKDNIPDSVITKIKPYIDREDFDPAAIKKASVACEAICMWVRAMDKYYHVSKVVEPKRVLLRKAEAELQVTMGQLNEAKRRLQEVVDKIERLEAEYNSAVEKQDQLARDIEDCQVKLDRAQKLIGGLGGEKARWTEQVQMLGAQYELIPGNALVASGMVSYAGPFTSLYRGELEKGWLNALRDAQIPHTEGTSMSSFLGEPVKIRVWNAAGLPNDGLSIENGIIIDKARRWPLMIDPQGQANRFLKNMGKQTPEGIDVCKLSQTSFLRTLELAIQFGKWLLLENIGEELDPALEPVLLQQKVKDGTSYVIRLGDKTVTWTDTFRFYMTTTLPNPHYPPETSVKVTLLNFAITREGLEEQMLGLVVAKEAPDLEEKKSALVQSNAKMRKDLKDLEDEILRLLSTSEGNILEDETLINTLAASKKTSEEINEKVKEAEITEKEIDAARESYRPVAYQASVLFFCIVDLANIDPMYQYSLQWFQSLFGMGIDQAPASAVLEERLQNLQDYFAYLLYENICRSLFEKHKTLFSFSMCIKLMTGYNRLDLTEVRFLLTGPTGEAQGPANPTSWLTEKEWNEVVSLSQLPAFKGLDVYFVQHVDEFKRIFDAVEAHMESLPGSWDTRLNGMQKLCFLRTIRSDKVVDAVVEFVASELGRRFVEPPTFDLAKSYKDSTNLTPLIFILSAGSDPVADILAFANEMNMAKKMESISLGQGQGPKAQRMIEDGCSRGGWVLLQNCHLAASWMPEMERICEQLDPNQTHRDFRLWLTSMPAKTFPVAVLQNGVKMTNEPPKGLRANLLRSYAAIDDRVLEDCKKPDALKKLLFGFSFFHAIVQDRRKFGPIGWNIQYEFTTEDLMVCRRQLKIFLDGYEEIPYKVLNYIGAQINYGGRVTDDKDKRLIQFILKTYCCRDLIEQADEYKFSSSGMYFCPTSEDHQGFVDYIKTLPLIPAPEVFGLHDNANITFAQNETLALLNGILSMAPRSGGGGASKKEQVMEETAQVILDKTPPVFDLDKVLEKYPTKYEESLNTVLTQEVIRYNRLLAVMRSSLPEFKKALKGLVVMSEELEQLGNSMFDNQVPKMWEKKGFLSLKPLASWIKDLNDRVAFLNKWITEGTPAVFWISGLFFPQAFLTGTLQNYARRHVIAIDRLSFNFQVMDQLKAEQVTDKPKDGCYISGIYLEGARWCKETHALSESKPKVLFEELPMVWLIPVADRDPPKDGVYNCPIYKVVSRAGTLSTTGHSTNFVQYIDLPSADDQDKWIKAGVAGFLALRY